ncbi:hypothetical protein MKW92_026263, partial [Papaver armeniacum]
MATALVLSPLTSSSAQLGHSVIHSTSNFLENCFQTVWSSITSSLFMSPKKQSSNGGHEMDPMKFNRKGSNNVNHESSKNYEMSKSAEQIVVEISNMIHPIIIV